MTEQESGSKKDVVKEIFERPKAAGDKVSSLFTPSKSPHKVTVPKKIKLPSFFKKLPAAIDIGASGIKLLQLAKRKAKDEFEIIFVDREFYPAGQKLPLIAYQKEALKKIIKRNTISPEVVAGIPLREARLYNLTFPRMSEEELSQAIRWKLTQLRPFGLNIESIVYNFIKSDTSPSSPSVQQKILVVCSSKEIVQNKISLLKEAGLKPVAIEVAPLSLLNLDKLKKSSTANEKVVMRLELGAGESTQIIARGSILYFCRGLTLTSRHMTKHIAQHCHLTEEDAEKLKKEYGLTAWSADKKNSLFLSEGKEPQKAEDKPSMVYSSLISTMESLVVDIEHSFKSFSYQAPQTQITKFDQVILSGGGAHLKNLEPFLKSRLGVPTELAKPFTCFRLSDNLLNQKKDLIPLQTEFAVAAGLAAGGIIEDAQRINLMPEKEKKGIGFVLERLWEKPKKLAPLILVLAVFSVSLQIGKVRFYQRQMRSITQKFQAAQVQLTQQQGSQVTLVEEEGRLQVRKDELGERLKFLNEAVRKPADFSKILADVAGLLPEEIWITSLVYSENNLKITGATLNPGLVMDLIETLNSSDNFTETIFNSTQKESGSEIYNFEIAANVKPSM